MLQNAVRKGICRIVSKVRFYQCADVAQLHHWPHLVEFTASGMKMSAWFLKIKFVFLKYDKIKHSNLQHHLPSKRPEVFCCYCHNHCFGVTAASPPDQHPLCRLGQTSIPRPPPIHHLCPTFLCMLCCQSKKYSILTGLDHGKSPMQFPWKKLPYEWKSQGLQNHWVEQTRRWEAI